MKNVGRCIMLLPVGLSVALFIYPLLHEAGHCMAALLCGETVVSLSWFPLPTVLCRIRETGAVPVAVIGFGGMLLPYLLTAFSPPRRFWAWYIWLLVKGISLLALVLSAIAAVMFSAGKPIVNEDMTQILRCGAEYTVLYICGLLLLSFVSAWQIVRAQPLQRCIAAFDLQAKSE